MGLPSLTEKIASKIWTTMTWAVHDGDVLVVQAVRSILGWRTTAWWRNRSSRDGVGPQQCSEVEAQNWVP